jgi:uncharacterized protein YbbC (DUF1343 family)
MLSLAAIAIATTLLPMDMPIDQGRNGSTLAGLDVLVREGFSSLKGKRVGLITNHTGVDHNGKRGIDLMRQAGVNLAVLFAPEHGFAGTEDVGNLKNTKDPLTGITVYSLYGETLRPKPEMLAGLDGLIFDIADVGVRFYTYETTMAFAMEEAAKAKVPFYVLDRPNPITGTRVEGPPLDGENVSFTGYLPGTPARHGLTMGELAQLFNAEKKLGADLHVVKMVDWQRSDWFDDTHLPWINPSPNMRSLKAAILYPGICIVEFAPNLSVGRGTDSPFEQIGADYINGRALAKYLNNRRLAGLKFYPTSFTPTESRFKGVRVEGVRIEITNREAVESFELGLEVACALQKLYPGKIDWKLGGARRLNGSTDVASRIAAGEDPRQIAASYQKGLEAFKKKRQPYLLYR